MPVGGGVVGHVKPAPSPVGVAHHALREEVEQWVECGDYRDHHIGRLSPTIGEPTDAAAEAVPVASL
jgi:hypothetical protein